MVGRLGGFKIIAARPVRIPVPKRFLRDWGVAPEVALFPVAFFSSESLIDGEPFAFSPEAATALFEFSANDAAYPNFFFDGDAAFFVRARCDSKMRGGMSTGKSFSSNRTLSIS